MINPTQDTDNFLRFYTQKKQRIDLYLDMSTQKVVGITKLNFKPKSDIKDEIPEVLNLFLNCENMNIISVKLDKTAKISKEGSDQGGGGEKIKNNEANKNLIPLKYNYISTNDYKKYLDELYENIEEIESFKNLNRVEWEIRKKGNLSIAIPKEYIIDNTNQDISNNDNSVINEDNLDKNNNNNNKKNGALLISDIKIIISYKLQEKNIGIIFQEFYESRTNKRYNLCYTPNFYYNTQNWVPCIYSLSLQILWSLYIYIQDSYIVYTSCFLNQIAKDKNGKKLIISKSNEPTTARNIGFIALDEKIFTRYFDNSNKNFLIVGNESKREKIEKNLINNKLISTLYNYYEEFFDINETNIKSNLNTPTAIIFIPYLAINCPFQNFKKFLKLKEEFYFSIIKFPSLYIIPEKYIYSQHIPEISKIQLRMLSKIFITNYIGGLIIEKTYADFWIINGLETWLSNLFLNKVFDNAYIKAKLYKYILKYKKLCKEGKEVLPLYTNNFTHPIEMQLNPVFNIKSKIIFHLLESKIEKTFIQKALKNIINERHKKGYNLSTEYLIKIFKKNCGIDLKKQFIDLYVYKTGMFKIFLDYTYNQKTNSIDIKIKQEQIAKKYYEKHPYFNIEEIDIQFLDKIGKNIQIIDYKTKPTRYFDIFVKLNILQTNGIEILKDLHDIKLESDKETYTQNFPLISKIRKSDLKKREQEFIQDLIDNTGINKIYSNEEIEKIFTQNSVLWLRIDPDIISLHINNIKQQHILYEYIKIFRDGDYIGQMESLDNIGKSSENYNNTLKILRTLVEYPNIYYKIRQEAIRIYVKILLKQKNEDEYQFLLEVLDDCYNELLKNKTNLNLETYYIMKEIVKFLGEYKETNFTRFYYVGLVTNSNIQNIIIEKFMAILFSNELNTITGYDNCYIMANILISCSKLNLQEKAGYLLKKILKNLRIEKLKRSENEITIISTLYALINLLIRNKFFIMKEKNKFNNILNEIFQEVNYYINHDTENYELRVFLEYFYIFLIFYESKSYHEFCTNLSNYFFNYEKAKNNINNNIINNSNKSEEESILSIKSNFELVTKIKALSYLLEDDIIVFESVEDKIILLSFLKKILFSPLCYLRGDCRLIMEELYEKIYKQEIEINKEENTENTSNKLLFPKNYSKFLEKINKNYINYCSKSYADDDWLYGFINEERASMESDEEENMDQDEMSNDTHKYGNINGISSFQIKKFRQKYKDDDYALNNLEVNLDQDFNDILNDIVNKLLNHPMSEPFSYELNEQTLGDLYVQYMDMISDPIDLDTIQKKVLNNHYENFISFNNDVLLMFRNCRTFNERYSKLYIQGIHMEDYYRLIISQIKKNRLINKNYVPMPKKNNNNNKISINLFDNTNAINEQSEKKKININKSVSNFSNNEEQNEINNNESGGNNKFIVPFDISDLNSNPENNEGEKSNKKEMLGKKTKKGKNNKYKKNKKNNDSNNEINDNSMNLEENNDK